MARPTTGSIVEDQRLNGTLYSLRFTVDGSRRYERIGGSWEGVTRRRAEHRLRQVLGDVDRGRWQPPATPEVPTGPPTFHVFASQWFASVERDLRPNTVLDYRWQLQHHLLPFFADHELADITIAEVDRYRDAKLAEGTLSAESINKTLTRLGQVLERAVEYDVIPRNPVRVGRRKLRTRNAQRSYLDDAGQVADLIAAAGELDAEARGDRAHLPRRAIVATLAFTGLRIDEALSLRWRSVDLAGGRLQVHDSKTTAGVRHVTLQPALSHELRTWKTRTGRSGPDDHVFCSPTGRKLSDDNVRPRVFAKAVQRATERRVALDLPPLPDKLTPHSLRRTYISALLALGTEIPVVMAEVGHADPKVTLGIYAQIMRRDPDAKARLAALLEARLIGTLGAWQIAAPAEDLDALADVEASDTPDRA